VQPNPPQATGNEGKQIDKPKETMPPAILVTYEQACGTAGNPLISSERALADSIRMELGPRGIPRGLTVKVVAGYIPRREGSGAGIVVAGQFRVCPPNGNASEKCEPPPANCSTTSCDVEFHNQQIQNRTRAESRLAEAIAGAIESENYEARSVCSSR
jgi:hypothetical protein